DGVKETIGLCIAVALDDNALQPQQACTVEFGRVDLFTQITQQRRRQPGTKTAEPVSVGAFAHRVFNDAHHAGTAFDHDIADKTVTDDNVDLAAENFITLDKT